MGDDICARVLTHVCEHARVHMESVSSLLLFPKVKHTHRH